jgi:hypothetical protein
MAHGSRAASLRIRPRRPVTGTSSGWIDERAMAAESHPITKPDLETFHVLFPHLAGGEGGAGVTGAPVAAAAVPAPGQSREQCLPGWARVDADRNYGI